MGDRGVAFGHRGRSWRHFLPSLAFAIPPRRSAAGLEWTIRGFMCTMDFKFLGKGV
jgi:hypothetical protein